MPDNNTLMILIPLVLLVVGLFAQAHFQNKNMNARMDRLEDRHEALRAEMREGFARVDAKVDKNHAETMAEFRGYDRQLARMQNSLDLLLGMHRFHPPVDHPHEEQHINEPTADD